MIKLTREQQRANQVLATAKTAGIEKFKLYTEPREIYMKENTYGIRKVVNNCKTTMREAVDAVKTIDGKPVSGWIVNFGNRQRKFVTEADGYKVI